MRGASPAPHQCGQSRNESAPFPPRHSTVAELSLYPTDRQERLLAKLVEEEDAVLSTYGS